VTYAVDTNVFIEAANRYYRFGMPPGDWFWELIHAAVDEKLLTSAEKMREELMPAGDELTDWAKKYGDELWTPPDANVLNEVRDLVTWAQNKVEPAGQYLQSAVDEFASGDVFLIGTAAAKGLTVVTHELSSPMSKKRIMIPDACAEVGVPCVDPWAMLEDLNDTLGE